MEHEMDDDELISALADGQLQGDDFARAMARVAAQPSARADWHAYHLIGDVLRSGELARGTPAPDFLQALSARLAQESAGRPRPAQLPPLQVQPQPAVAANDFRWKLVAGVASVAAFAAVGWSVLAPAGPAGSPQLAVAPPASAPAGGTVLAQSEPGVMIRDPKLDELLAAHRQFGGASALQMPAGFLRNATFEGPSR